MAALNVAFWRPGGLGPKAGSERTWVPFVSPGATEGRLGGGWSRGPGGRAVEQRVLLVHQEALRRGYETVSVPLQRPADASDGVTPTPTGGIFPAMQDVVPCPQDSRRGTFVAGNTVAEVTLPAGP
jgi:hypothetical protein